MIFKNNNKSPNELHDFLIENDCKPNFLSHNAEYNEIGKKTREATEVYIEIREEKEQELTSLINQFMSL